MSYEQHQLDTILDIQADFDMALAEKKWDDAKALIQQMGDLGYETEALFLHQAYNRAIAEIDPTAPVYVPMEDNDHPILTPEETDAPQLHSGTFADFAGVSEESLEQMRLRDEDRSY